MATLAVDLFGGGAIWTPEEINGMVRIVVGLSLVSIALAVLFLAIAAKAFKATTRKPGRELSPAIEPSIARLLKEDMASEHLADVPLPGATEPSPEDF